MEERPPRGPGNRRCATLLAGLARRRGRGSDGDVRSPAVVVTVSPAPDPGVLQEWDRFVDSVPDSDVAQLSAWARIRYEAGYRPLYLLARQDGQAFGPCPRARAPAASSWPARLRVERTPRLPGRHAGTRDRLTRLHVGGPRPHAAARVVCAAARRRPRHQRPAPRAGLSAVVGGDRARSVHPGRPPPRRRGPTQAA